MSKKQIKKEFREFNAPVHRALREMKELFLYERAHASDRGEKEEVSERRTSVREKLKSK